ncbi:GNAT family N-acetyltransferase [Pseudomonas sp. MAFF212428]|uniref:GNAT family N-acetyltransferase n=1 Tax=Pseudomonas brassicae TaxID=2708063 RepID=A0A6B3NXV2_9PSED|nr:N-acetyltransferase [Pseudomonas brassicae]NER61843.1 GNAT family N-acetyltransferase [Pseudomonas brassicae]NER64467.1 GNAT family N-acetyltransferase [Pseudomonas brassicae]
MLQIRPMTTTDFDRFWPTFQAVITARETYAYDPALSLPQARQLWLELPLHTWVVEDAGELLGSYYLKANAAGPGSHVSNCGYMVSEAARGRGVARMMCEHSQRVARNEGFVAMQFNSVVSSNEVAVALWQKLGFETVGRLPKAYRHARLGLVDCLVMYKWLGETAAPEQPRLIGRKNIEAVVSRKRGR